jgi:microsomal dipeptidase-like Zn-dependent dipeptidase
VIVDLHAHYPLHLLADEGGALRWMTRSGQVRLRDRLRAFVLRIANWIGNYDKPDDPAVTVPNLRSGNVMVVLSVLYAPFDEMDLSQPYGAPPTKAYVEDLVGQIRMVEEEIAQRHSNEALVAHNGQELGSALAQNKVALIHAVEGGFHLGASEDDVRANVRRLSLLGVAYVTLAHLFWRRVATDAPALPFLPDWLYALLFPQPDCGLTSLGRAAVREMVQQRMLIDVTHMSVRSLDETFELLDEIDPGRTVPVFASHAACHFGSLKYNLEDRHIKAIADRHGVVGLIVCTHYMSDGRKKPGSVEESLQLVCEHIDRIRAASGGSLDHVAFGTDLDGFIKPTLPGFEKPKVFRDVERALHERYGEDGASRICSGNALRLLEYWGTRAS